MYDMEKRIFAYLGLVQVCGRPENKTCKNFYRSS